MQALGFASKSEFALHKDQRTLYAVAKPVIQWGGTLSVLGRSKAERQPFPSNSCAQ